MSRVLGLGDNVCDVYLHENTMYPGGQAVNFAVNAASLGASADYMGVFGRDAVAEHVQKTLDAHGVGHSHCRSYPGENGFARVTLEDGDRVFKGSNRGGVIQQHPIFLDEKDREYAAGFDLIHTTNNGFLDGLLPELYTCTNSEHPVWISYDFSYRWNEEDRVKRVCPYIHFAFLSCSDLSDMETEALCRHLYREMCAPAEARGDISPSAYGAPGPHVITATRGSRGSLTFDGRDFYAQEPDLVKAVDTMGAGDAFATAMLVELCGKMLPERSGRAVPAERLKLFLPEALKAAAAFAAKACLTRGAFGDGVPVPEELHDRIFADIL